MFARAQSRPSRSTEAARLAGLELSPIKAVELHAARLPDVVSLAQGIPSFDTPEPIKEFAREMIAEGECAKYSVSPGLPRLREAIAEALARDGMRYDPGDEILVTAGSIEAIAATLLAQIDPGDEVLVVSPTYASYQQAIRIAGGVPRFVPLNEDANFDLDPAAIEGAVGRRTRALLICNPNNPTGTVFSRAQTLRMLEVAERHDLLIIADEVYKDFLYGGAQVFSPAMETAVRDRVVRVFSFSKAYAMTGWRVGFLHGPAPRVASILKVHDSLVTCAPVVSQYAALAALELGHASIAAFRDEFRRRRDRVIERLDALPLVFDYQKPNASYFVFPRVKDTVPHARDSCRLAAEILEHARVALVPGAAFGPTGESHLRICYARPTEDIDVAFDRLADFFAGRPASGPPAPPPRSAAPRARPFLRRCGVSTVRALARLHLKRTRPRVIAITGSLGKTVLKRTLLDLLAPYGHVRANPLSYNTDIGVALAILGGELADGSPRALAATLLGCARRALLTPASLDILILELGIRRRGDMRAHLRMLQPDLTVVMPLEPGARGDHAALTVLREEVRTLCAASTGRPVLLCSDDPWLAELAISAPAAVTFSRHDIEDSGERRTVSLGGRRVATSRDVVGASSRCSLVAALKVGELLGLPEDALRAFLDEPAATPDRDAPETSPRPGNG